MKYRGSVLPFLLSLFGGAAVAAVTLSGSAGCSGTIPVSARPELAPPTPAEAQSFARGSNAFGVDLYKNVATEEGNLAFSPASLSMALAMTWGGAKGETADEMKRVLHFEGSAEEVAGAAGRLASQLEDPARPVTFQIANQLFGEASIKLEQPFLERTRDAFGAPLVQVDFLGNFAEARVDINEWAAAKTHRKIQNLIPEGGLNADTRLVLVNALYFFGDWEVPFEKEGTYDAPFRTGAGEVKSTPMMHSPDHGSYSFVAKDGVKLLSIPYKGRAMSMLFLLPDAIDGLPALENSLSLEKLDGLVGALEKDKRVVVSLPKFEIDPQNSLSLDKVLSRMGMPTAFDERKADFTAIFNSPAVEDRLHIEKVFHKAFLKLDEKGTEAAAASAVVMAKATAAAQNDGEFTADHPFLFVLRDESTGLAVFMGRVSDPTVK